ncbi:UMP kinase, partial [Candidatus Bathyarchaeota archaeon]|nr:UMP kinase [Candidatus Bathyarchaeota archaeon]
GGLKPGMTTDTVAALVAQKVGAQLLVKATDQEGIYTKDPRKHRDAKKLDTITFKDLALLLSQNRHKAGIHQILDPIAIRILQEAKIKTVIVDGFNPENIQLAIEGAEIGTTITE